MEQSTTLFPVFTLVALTFAVGFWMVKLRFMAVKKGVLSPKHFRLNRDGEVPDFLAKVSNNYDNLLALPVLFYVVSGFLLIALQVGLVQIMMAWVFVGSRYMHSYIHTTYNNVIHRMMAFMLGVVTLISMWGLFFVRMMQA